MQTQKKVDAIGGRGARAELVSVRGAAAASSRQREYWCATPAARPPLRSVSRLAAAHPPARRSTPTAPTETALATQRTPVFRPRISPRRRARADILLVPTSAPEADLST